MSLGEDNKPVFIQHCWNAILDDDWMWIVVWGKPRKGKTTVQLLTAFDIYKDWDKVIQCFVYNLAGILYKIDKGIPARICTRNGFHERVPILCPDDFGATGNKAKTQHEPAWDIFKGTFDTLATKVSILMASMGTPTSPTQQLHEKYTHEIYVAEKGWAKYDIVNWEQNYRGWQARQDKTWLETFAFKQVPLDVYKEYDVMRMGLVDELEQLIKDSMADNEVLRVLRRLNDKDKEFLLKLRSDLCLQYAWIQDHNFREQLIRAKARSLVVPMKRQTTYWYELTEFGMEVLSALDKITSGNEENKESEESPKVLIH